MLGETVVIASTPGHLKIGSDIVTSERGSSREELDLDIDGKETVFPEGPRLSFKRSDDTTFDVIISVNNKTFGNHLEKLHFTFSADGNRLTETKTHTEREVVSEGLDQSQGKVIRTSTSDLIFYKILFIPPAGPVFLRPIEAASEPRPAGSATNTARASITPDFERVRDNSRVNRGTKRPSIIPDHALIWNVSHGRGKIQMSRLDFR
jgi:hypothetical protein